MKFAPTRTATADDVLDNLTERMAVVPPLKLPSRVRRVEQQQWIGRVLPITALRG
jgi:hypothetical protein